MTAEPTAKIDVTVLVVSWNTRDLLRECLAALGAVSRLRVQTIVVDNASSDSSAEMVRAEFPTVRLLPLVDNLGFVGGNNLAFAESDSSARYVLLLNPDAILRPDALEKLVAVMNSHPDSGAVGPLTLNPDFTLQPSWTRFPTIWSEVRGVHNRRFTGSRQPAAQDAESVRALPDAMPVDWVSGACLLVRREALSRDLADILFDPDFAMYCEETDLCYRLHQAGWRTYFAPQAEVIHHYGQSSRQAPIRTVKLLYQSKITFFRKHYGPAQTFILKVGAGSASALKWALYSLLAMLPLPDRTNIAHRRACQQAVLSVILNSRAGSFRVKSRIPGRQSRTTV